MLIQAGASATFRERAARTADVIGETQDEARRRAELRAAPGAPTHTSFAGTPRQIADHLKEWLAADAVDGFTFIPSDLPADLEELVELVVPELQRRGIYRTDYAGPTLRDNLGLPRPAKPLLAVASPPRPNVWGGCGGLTPMCDASGSPRMRPPGGSQSQRPPENYLDTPGCGPTPASGRR